MNAKIIALPLSLPVTTPHELDTPRFTALWEKWTDHRKAYKRPGRGWDEFFQDQLNWLAKYGEDVAYRTVEASYHNGWQGLFPDRFAMRARPKNPEMPLWKMEQLLKEELSGLDNDLQYEFDYKNKPDKVARRNMVKAQLAVVQQKLRGAIVKRG